MDGLTNLPRIGSDDDWLELGDGEQGLLRGRLYGPLKAGDDSLIVANTSWEVIAVTIMPHYDGEALPAGTSVSIVATRTEDGLEMKSDDMLVHHEEK